MRIIQLLPALHYGDAVGNDAVAMHGLLKEWGYDTAMYAPDIDARIPEGMAYTCDKLPKLENEDILIYHYAIACPLVENILRNVPGRKIMIYHNVTPGEFFTAYNPDVAAVATQGRVNLHQIKDIFTACLADSIYNKKELIEAGYTCPIAVLPILIPFEDYRKKPSSEIIECYGKDSFTNILFVGRLVPNKRIEDVIRAFAYYKRYLNEYSRLFLVGSPEGMDKYVDRLHRYVRHLTVEGNVVFTGKVPFDHILAYYQLADVFLCMSEHEGFCVPLVEAMNFSIPVVARASAAVPETLGKGGVLVKDNNPAHAARVLDDIIEHEERRNAIKQLGAERLADFSYKKVADLFHKLLEQILQGDSSDKAWAADEAEPPVVVVEEDGGGLTEGIPAIDVIPIAGEVVDDVVPAPMPESFRHKVKTRILKPAYMMFSKVSPSMAESIRLKIYGAVNRMNERKHQQMEAGMAVLSRKSAALLVDVTQTTRSDAGTGIQRVVNKAFRNLSLINNNVLAVRDECGTLITANKYTKRWEKDGGAPAPEKLVKYHKGDKFLLLDSSWEFYPDFSKFLTESAEQGIPSYGIVFDLFPIQYPELFNENTPFVSLFKGWHNMLLNQADHLLCISRTTADVVAAYYEKMDFKRNKPLYLHYFHMGSDISGGTMAARSAICDFVKGGKTFLMVGTVEPRKGHAVAIQAFEKVLDTESVRLLILGHNGWKNKEFYDSLKGNKKLRENVLWIKDATDEELRWAYANTDALIAASKDEGFGLPLIEAAYFGLPIICSDIPIFREVTQGHADYFKAMDADALAVCLSEWMQAEKHPDSRKIHIYTWQEAAQEILDIVHGKKESYKVLG